MASGSSKGFDFASDDILCSYEDYTNQDNSNGTHSDSAIASKEFHKNRMARTSAFPASSYSPPDDSGNHDVIISAVERSTKKYADNLMRFLEGLSSRLSQLELYCYNLDKSIGEMRSDLARDHGESDVKLKFLEKHLQEVHRSVQILRDKQELADTQKELAKLHLAQKESSSGHNSHQSEERSSTPSSDTKRNENAADLHGQQLALVLPHQVAPLPVPQPAAPQPQMAPQPMSQSPAYYLPPPQLSNTPGPTQLNQGQYLQSDSQYQTPPPPLQSQVSQPQPQPQRQPQPQPQSQIHSHPQYQQQWAQQQVSQQVQPPQPGARPSSPQVYPSYLPSQQVNPSTPEALPNSMPMQMPYSGIPQPGSSQAMTYPYGGPGRTAQAQPQPQPQPQPPQHPPPQHLKAAFGGQPSDGYVAGGHSTMPQGNAYMMYDGEGGRVPHPSHPTHFPQAGYPQNLQQITGNSVMSRPPLQFMRNHPYNELIDKLVSMGYRGDHVMTVIQRLEESGQTVDFNAVLDRLNINPSGGSQRGWSG